MSKIREELEKNLQKLQSAAITVKSQIIRAQQQIEQLIVHGHNLDGQVQAYADLLNNPEICEPKKSGKNKNKKPDKDKKTENDKDKNA
jgi:hypothetical protein